MNNEGNTWPEQEIIEKWWREHSHELKEKLTSFKRHADENGESYPKGWVRVVLVISPDSKEIHAIGGDRAPGEGDTAYLGLKMIKALLAEKTST